MEQNLQRLQQQNPKAKVASAVVLNVKTGEVLAMASSPALNPDDWKGNFKPELTDYYIPQGSYDPMKPGALSNRAIQSTYPPGSTFKPITGMAALEMGVMDPLHDLVNCSGSYWVAPFIKCTGVHGNVSYYNALAVSCNTYFQEMGRRAGKDEIIHVASEFGLGSRTGIDLPYEEKGLLPTAAWKKEIGTALLKRKYERLFKELDRKYANLMLDAADAEERQKLERKKDAEKAQLEAERKIDYNFNTNWQPYNTFNMSIGQGDNDYTVIQLANYAATIANGGFLMKPHVVKKIVSHEGKVLKIIKPEVVHEVDISPLSIAETKRAMLAVTQPGGTAYSLFSHFPADIQVGAKTGTAETGRSGDNPRKEYHGVFIAFAPVDNPQIAMAAVVEYGNAGYASAGYLVRDVFEQYFGVKDHLTSPEAEKNCLNEVARILT
ncbi:penicillin-binding transpeptidase domain-containing protein [Syntrophomonas palmitatica]|uniref:penicillin-binding transpeptidase domain-containing protein n=1 Tax=Syntrophomonas palmitatica TaxID=402877 RepID=UPI0034E2EE92